MIAAITWVCCKEYLEYKIQMTDTKFNTFPVAVEGRDAGVEVEKSMLKAPLKIKVPRFDVRRRCCQDD